MPPLPFPRILPGLRHNRAQFYLALLLLWNVFWGSSLAVYKYLEQFLDTGAIVTLRFGLAAVLLACAWPFLPGPTPRGRDLIRTCLMGMLVFAVGHRLQVTGNRLGTASNSAVLMAMEPLITAVAAAWFLRETIPGRRWAGFTISLLGVLLLNSGGSQPFHWGGVAANFIFISSFLCEAAYSVLGYPMLARSGSARILAVALLAGAATNLALDGSTTLPALARLPAEAWLAGLFLALVCTALGYALWFEAIRVIDVNVAALTIFVQPIAGLPLAILWLGEPLHWGQLWGSLTIAAGIAFALASTHPQRPTRAEPS